MTQADYTTNSLRRIWLPALLLALLLAGCQGSTDEPVAAAPSTPVPPAALAPTPTATPALPVQATSTPAPTAVTYTTQAADPISADAASAPVQLRIPAIGLDVTVSPMAWRIAEVNGTRTTVWVLPEKGVGWHPNSARAGTVGNVVISGHQLLGDASFAPLALGDVTTGQEILLTDSQGQTFVYRVTAVSDPQPISTDNAEELALAARYTAQGTGASLTLITGWPDYSSTHRIFVTALFVGVQP